MNVDERLEALTVNLELAHRDIQDLLNVRYQHGENIEKFVKRIAEIHEQRLSNPGAEA